MRLGSRMRNGQRKSVSGFARLARAFVIAALLAVALPISLGKVSIAHAATLTVSVCNENGLTNAISSAASGDTIQFSCSGTITLHATISLGKNLTLDGSGYNVTIDGNGNNQILNVGTGFSLTVNNLTFTNANGSNSGGAIYSDGPLTVSNSTFTANTAAGTGGAIYHTGNGQLTVTNSTFTGNSAQGHSGAIDVDAAPGQPTALFTGDTFSGNSSGAGGGAMAFGFNSPAAVTGSTFVGNKSLNAGEALFTYNTLQLSFSTLVNNVASSGQIAAITLDTSGGNPNLTVGNTILDNPVNCGVAAGNPANTASFTDKSGNLVFQEGAGSSCSLGSTGNQFGKDPQLGPLQDNGGPTQTMALGAGSPAIDAAASCNDVAGNPVLVDQRGGERKQFSQCDVGAYEYGNAIFTGSPDGKYTNEGVTGNPLVFTGKADPNSTVQVLFGSEGATASGGGYISYINRCTTPSLASTTADSTGAWSVSITSGVAEDNGGDPSRDNFSTIETPSGGTAGTCGNTVYMYVDRTFPASVVTFPNAQSANNTASWAAGCAPDKPGICGTATDTYGVAAVFVAMQSSSGTTAGKFWDPSSSSFSSSTIIWNPTTLSPGDGYMAWNYAKSIPPDGTYTVLSGAIDNAGNAEPIIPATTLSCTAGIGGGVTYSTGGGVTYSTGGGATYSSGGGATYSSGGTSSCTVSGGVTYSAGGGITYSTGGGATYSSGGGATYSNGGGCPTGGGVTYSAGGGVTYSNGGGATYSTGGLAGGCNFASAIIDTQPPVVTGISAGGSITSGSSNVNPASSVRITFDGGNDPTSITPANINLSPAAGIPTCGSDLTCTNVTIPQSSLSPNTTYTLTVNNVVDWAGNVMTTPYTFQFTTASLASPTGTLPSGLPANGDVDGDGIWNAADGGSFTTPSGTTINTGAWGFSPTSKDVCVVENYMQGTAADGYSGSQAISQAANAAIVNAFKAQGIHLVIFEGDAAHSAGLPGTPGGPSGVAAYSGPWYGGSIPMVDPLGNMTSGGAFDWTATYPGTADSFDSIRTRSFVPTGLAQLCHYAVIAHNIANTRVSGSSRGFGASDFVIALGTTSTKTGNQQEQQGTVMHELGHNLGLQHGGGDAYNDKPNYPSVMNYLFQFGGIETGVPPYLPDYSHGKLASINEGALSDSAGLGPAAAGLGTLYFCPSGATNAVADASMAINWGCNSTGPASGTHAADVNGDGSQTTLSDFNDWGNLVFNGGVIGLGARPATTPPPIDTTGDPTGSDDPVLLEQKSTVKFNWNGFFSPLNSDFTGTQENVGKAGRTYPVKFQLRDTSGYYVSALSAVRAINSTAVACPGVTSTTTITTSTTSSAGLKYDPTANQYVYNYQTPSQTGCYVLTFTLEDGTTPKALFKLT